MDTLRLHLAERISNTAAFRIVIAIICLFLSLLIFPLSSLVFAKDSYPPLDIRLSTSQTVIGQPFAYPQGTAKITAGIVTINPGDTTGWHKHDVPLFGYIMEGELKVDYGPDGIKTYKTGDTLVEAFKTRHNGINQNEKPVRILIVLVGSDRAANTVSESTTEVGEDRHGETD